MHIKKSERIGSQRNNTGENMLNLFSKGRLAALLVPLFLGTMNTSLAAWDCCEEPSCNRLYIGAFGGALFSDSSEMSQMGTAFFPEASGGPLAVYGKGDSKKVTIGYGGVQVGYEWSKGFEIGCSGWSIAPAGELEAFFYNHKRKGELINPTDRLPEHDFLVSFNLNSSTLLANAVFSLKSCCLGDFTPYLGAGIGATHLSLKNANSEQIDPPEADINHFNSKRSDSTWAFAAQIKAGLSYTFCEKFHVFAEYRYLFIDSNNYILGSTVYPNHVPTSPWNVKVSNTHYNAFAVGLQYDL